MITLNSKLELELLFKKDQKDIIWLLMQLFEEFELIGPKLSPNMKEIKWKVEEDRENRN
jgi:hypothetical protein